MDWVQGMTVGEAKALVGTEIVPNPFPKKDFGALNEYVSVPSGFDSRKQWPGCVHAILNQ